MGKLRIGLDLDGVIVNWHRRVLEMLNARSLGTTHSYNFDTTFESPYWDWIQENVTKEDWEWLWTKGQISSYHNALPYEGAEKFVKALREKADLIILTARPPLSWGTTISWWHSHFNFTPAGFNFFTVSGTKGLVNCDVYVEDSLEVAISIGGAVPAAKVFLLDRPWNKEYTDALPGNVVRVFGYEEILRRIDEESQ